MNLKENRNDSNESKSVNVDKQVVHIDKCISQNNNKQAEGYAICPICFTYCDERAVECASCLNWYHYVCLKLTDSEIIQFETSSTELFTCNSCAQLQDFLDLEPGRGGDNIISDDDEVTKLKTLYVSPGKHNTSNMLQDIQTTNHSEKQGCQIGNQISEQDNNPKITSDQQTSQHIDSSNDIKLLLHEQRIRQLEHENLKVSIRMEKLETLSSMNQSHTKKRNNKKAKSHNIKKSKEPASHTASPNCQATNCLSDTVIDQNCNLNASLTQTPIMQSSEIHPTQSTFSSATYAQATNIPQCSNQSTMAFQNNNHHFLVAGMTQMKPPWIPPTTTQRVPISMPIMHQPTLQMRSYATQMPIVRSALYHTTLNASAADFLPGYSCFVKCVDDADPLPPSQRPRGKGVQLFDICYKNNISHAIEEQQDGSSRVTVVKINCRTKPLIIIGVYMPCSDSKNADDELKVVLEEIGK
ncbi:unnamed protein product [Mytilus edulis]|uniref:Zinc finger PHD-type domain-containing protein n=1 Tax=Mytilus edulis TaxID=6550 RepID=A0A8S3S3T1_MYTED|nr:unnamed protein product [Mytilus edulis]